MSRKMENKLKNSGNSEVCVENSAESTALAAAIALALAAQFQQQKKFEP
ncbi:hypothetical protein [Ammoniphilus oxalaticus]|nr:hypothetical protein [Ammoniphilus oxalaticus]